MQIRYSSGISVFQSLVFIAIASWRFLHMHTNPPPPNPFSSEHVVFIRVHFVVCIVYSCRSFPLVLFNLCQLCIACNSL